MHLSSVIIFAAFALSATASPIDGYISRSNSIRKRADHTGGQASQGLGGSDTFSKPLELHYPDGTVTRDSVHAASGEKFSYVKWHSGGLWRVFVPSTSRFLQNPYAALHYGKYKEYHLPYEIYVQDFHGQRDDLMFSQVKLNRQFARNYARQNEHESQYMDLEQGLWMASYPEELSKPEHSFTFIAFDATNGHVRDYFDPLGGLMLSIKQVRGQWEVKYAERFV